MIFSLNTIQAVGEGNYGRLGRGQQQRYTSAKAAPMFEPDEQPGALPEVLPSPDQNANIDRCWICRSMVMQAWGHYPRRRGSIPGIPEDAFPARDSDGRS